ncbi:MAG: ankyrin repeat domain-containing protein [Candidatus Babeliales bacterium]
MKNFFCRQSLLSFVLISGVMTQSDIAQGMHPSADELGHKLFETVAQFSMDNNHHPTKIDFVRKLIAAHANVNVPNVLDNTPLIEAASMGAVLKRSAYVNALLDAGADVNIQGFNGRTALMWAAHDGDHEMCRTLIAAKSNITLCNGEGHTALMLAARWGNPTALSVLIEAHNNLLRSRKQVLFATWTAAPMEICDMVHPFVEDFINDIDNTGKTPLILAVWQATILPYLGQLEDTVRVLLAAGADTTVIDNDGHTARYYAEQMADSPSKDAVLALLSA